MAVDSKTKDLPVNATLPELEDVLQGNTLVLLQAPPGAGKTTLVPLALRNADWLGGQKILMLEPRRLATRSVARHMAHLLDEKVGETVGYRVRMDSQIGPDTIIEVVTEGILTRRLQQDPDLTGVGLVIFDEFHERNLQSDLGLALCLQAQEILREDLRLLIMSATLDASSIVNVLGDIPVVTSEGRQYPVSVSYSPRAVKGRIEQPLASMVLQACSEQNGDVLVFLPGAGEINRVKTILEGQLDKQKNVLLPLFGGLNQKQQDLVLLPDHQGRRKIILSTDIAETSLTIDGVTCVVDAGQMRNPRFDPNSGMSRLITERVSKASAEQRKGRAGRQSAGHCYRLWTEAENRGLVPHTEAEITNTDLTGLLLELAKWGIQNPSDLTWITDPPSGNFAQARDLLMTLNALDKDGVITDLGRRLVSLPLHPRLARMVVLAEQVDETATACDLAALLEDRDIMRPSRENPNTDIRARLELLNREREKGSPGPARQVLRASDDLRRRFKAGKGPAHMNAAGSLLAMAYPDRIGELRKNSEHQYRLSGGRGAQLLNNDKLSSEPYITVADLDGRGREATIYLAAPITYRQIRDQFKEDIKDRTIVKWDEKQNRITATDETVLGALILDSKRSKHPDPELISKALLSVIKKKGIKSLNWTDDCVSLVQRVGFVAQYNFDPGDWPDFSETALMETVDEWLLPYLAGLTQVDQLMSLKIEEILLSRLSREQQAALNELAPSHFKVPSGSRIRLDYSVPDAPVLAVRLQEVFGLESVPNVGQSNIAVSVHLLSPAGRPAQITMDLAGFWQNTYEDVKKDLRGRYPKHYWPDDPMQAEPTAKAKPRKNR